MTILTPEQAKATCVDFHQFPNGDYFYRKDKDHYYSFVRDGVDLINRLAITVCLPFDKDVMVGSDIMDGPDAGFMDSNTFYGFYIDGTDIIRKNAHVNAVCGSHLPLRSDKSYVILNTTKSVCDVLDTSHMVDLSAQYQWAEDAPKLSLAEDAPKLSLTDKIKRFFK